MTVQSSKPLCIVPARGSSKRLPRKNIAPLGGKPLLAWTLEPALDSGVFDEIWVSSEDREVLAVAEEWGANPLPRPLDLAGDRVTVVQLCAQVLADFAAQGRHFDALYVLLPSSPFRKGETIRKAWHAFQQSGADALMSVVPLDHPPQWALTDTDGRLSPLFPQEYEQPRHALVPAYRHDGGHAITKVDPFLETGVFIGQNTMAFSVSLMEAVDINEPIDLEWAEFLLNRSPKS